MDRPDRSRAARAAAETALARVVHHYGATPEFVVLGGLVPELLCRGSNYRHAGTTDIDVQVNLEIACGATNTERLERALMNAEFRVSQDGVWRWISDDPAHSKVEVKFELLADLENRPTGATFSFDSCKNLGAVNLRGTRFAAEDFTQTKLRAKIGGTVHEVSVNVTSVAGFLMAKTAAARERRKGKDWYDIVFVMRHNDFGGIEGAANAVLEKFGDRLDVIRSALDDLLANFEFPHCQGAIAYADQMLEDHPEENRETLLADAVLSVKSFYKQLFP